MNGLKEKIIQNLIAENRWKLFLNGLGITLEVTFFAVLIGIVLGFIIAIIRSSSKYTFKSATANLIMRVLDFICRVYLTVIRGTPVLVQLMIMYFVIFASSSNKVLAAVLSFGLNSAAYVAEIIRSGIMSIDGGQLEAGRSLGFNYASTMVYVIIPQAFKNVLPALANEFIVLLKETSVSAMIGLSDLTYGANLIRSRTYEAFFPLIFLALIYLVMVMLFSWLVSKLERRLRNSDR
ncbi:MAG: amino acid ABC transporter permease [Clostridia bacterium]|nr:amino acid ABC transporter permease [Clostridia bacterium]